MSAVGNYEVRDAILTLKWSDEGDGRVKLTIPVEPPLKVLSAQVWKAHAHFEKEDLMFRGQYAYPSLDGQSVEVDGYNDHSYNQTGKIYVRYVVAEMGC